MYRRKMAIWWWGTQCRHVVLIDFYSGSSTTRYIYSSRTVSCFARNRVAGFSLWLSSCMSVTYEAPHRSRWPKLKIAPLTTTLRSVSQPLYAAQAGDYYWFSPFEVCLNRWILMCIGYFKNNVKDLCKKCITTLPSSHPWKRSSHGLA